MKRFLVTKSFFCLVIVALTLVIFMKESWAVRMCISTFAGNGEGLENYDFGEWGHNGPASNAILYYPSTVAVDSQDNLYVADLFNIVRKVDTNGVITVFAGNGYQYRSGDNGPATQASLDFVSSINIDSMNNVYISSVYNHPLRKVDANGIITTVEENISGSGIASDSSENLYIADKRNHKVYKRDINGTITTIAGNGSPGFSGDNGSAINAMLKDPGDVVVDSRGNLYIADSGNSRIRRVNTNGIITTFAGNGQNRNFDDSYNGRYAVDASFFGPQGLAVDSNDNVYFADGGWGIFKIDTNGIITIFAGVNNGWGPGFSGDGGPATQADLRNPLDIAIYSRDNNVYAYIADSGNNRVRKIAPCLCGNGTMDSGEQCDDGNEDNTDACTNQCHIARCGDGFKGPGEGCDDGSVADNDGCSSSCQTERCGDRIVQSSEQCDDGNAADNDGCSSSCQRERCGDRIIQASEQCDDGYANGGHTDRCTSACKLAVCGDGLIRGDLEECDMGAANRDSGNCTTKCTNAKCGDGFIRANHEQCDDGNNLDNDGCFHCLIHPVITAVNAVDVTRTSATITWKTLNVDSDSNVHYRIKNARVGYSRAYSATLTKSHSVRLTGLSPLKAYEYYVCSRSSRWEAKCSPARDFLTFPTFKPGKGPKK